MPIYHYRCECGMDESLYQPLTTFTGFHDCYCGRQAQVVIGAPLLVKAAPDVCYDSPIDGSPITSWDKRREDLKRNGCREYDPEMKRDYHRNLKESEAKLDKAIESTVEEAIEKLPTRKRAQLHSELTEQGMTADVVRSTPHA